MVEQNTSANLYLLGPAVKEGPYSKRFMLHFTTLVLQENELEVSQMILYVAINLMRKI